MTEHNAVGVLLTKEHKARSGSAMQRHIAAIESGNVTKTNVIGLRKAVNHVARLAGGWSGNRSNATREEVNVALATLERCKPMVRGDLHASGVRLITDKRYKTRLESVADKIAALQGFSLVGFEEVRDCQYVPVYLAYGNAGTFRFYSVPWQSALAYGLESGPQLMGGV
jgi:uncharacterized protein YcfJ